MRVVVLYRLCLLAAIWGASFLFMRIAAPGIGFLWTAEIRGGLAGLALLLILLLSGKSLSWRTHWRQYMLIGVIGSALPFVLYSYAALHIPAGYSAIINSTSPLWSVFLGVLFWRQQLNYRIVAGLLCGVAGVSLLVSLGPVAWGRELVIGIACCLLASICYAIAGEYTKRAPNSISPAMMAAGSQLAAAIFLSAPTLAFAPLPLHASPQVYAAAVALALLSSALAYSLYFNIIQEIGPVKTLTVTFLIPVFAILWGWLFLDEAITSSMLVGCLLVIAAMVLVSYQKKNVAENQAAS